MQAKTAELYQSVWDELKGDRKVGEKIVCTTQDIGSLFAARGQLNSSAYQSANKLIKLLIENDVALKKVGFGRGAPLEALIINSVDFDFSNLVTKREKEKTDSRNGHHDDLEERLKRLENAATLRGDTQLKPGCVVMIDFDNINIYCQNMGFYFTEFWNKIVDFLNNNYGEPIKLVVAVVSEKTPQNLLGVLVRLNMKVMFGPRFKSFQKTDTVDEHIKTTVNFLLENTMIKSYVIASRDTDFTPTLFSIQQAGRSAIRVKPDERNIGDIVFMIGNAVMGKTKLEGRMKKRIGLNVDNALAAVDAYMGNGPAFTTELNNVTRKVAAVLKKLRRDDPRPFLELLKVVSERINEQEIGDKDVKYILEAFKTRGFIRRIVRNNITVYSIDPKLV